MRTTLKLIAAVLAGSMALASAADEDAKRKDKPAKKRAAKGLMSADKDKDGKVSLEEFKTWAAARKKPIEGERAAKLFKRRDKNGDGSLTKDEVRRARAAQRKKKGGEEGGKKKGEGKKKKDAA